MAWSDTGWSWRVSADDFGESSHLYIQRHEASSFQFGEKRYRQQYSLDVLENRKSWPSSKVNKLSPKYLSPFKKKLGSSAPYLVLENYIVKVEVGHLFQHLYLSFLHLFLALFKLQLRHFSYKLNIRKFYWMSSNFNKFLPPNFYQGCWMKIYWSLNSSLSQFFVLKLGNLEKSSF